MTTIAVIGLGYVGLPLAVEFGKKVIASSMVLSPISAMATRPVETRKASMNMSWRDR